MKLFQRLTLRARIFISMLFLLALSFLVTGAFSVYHFLRENEEYHEKRLLRKASNVSAAIDYHLSSYDMVAPSALDTIIRPKLQEWSDVHNLDIVFYNMNGQMIAYSNPQVLLHKDVKERLNPAFVLEVIRDGFKVVKSREDTTNILIAYQFVRDSYNQPLAIVSMPYFDNEVIPDQDIEFFEYLITLNIILFLLAVVIAGFLSNYITQSLSTIGKKLSKTQINSNERLHWKSNDEIGQLVEAYNRMLSELEEKAVKLARSERESAWKEMAQQVAHEIKNPLTPMRLMVQQLEYTLKTEDQEQLKEFVQGMLHQIDTMVSIADAFSRFADMPTAKRELVAIDELIKRTASVYTSLEIDLNLPETTVYINSDKDQLIRVLNNLIKNAWQAVPEDRTPKIEISLKQKEKVVLIEVKDNGSGIEASKRDRVFEPSFTTKTNGMGLGLAMCQNIVSGLGGKIWFESETEIGTTFMIELPK